MSLIVTGLFTFGGASAQILTGPLVVAQMQDWPGAKPTTTPDRAAPPATSNEKSVPSGNPLWAIPVASLTATRERPLFSPSRRPRPPVAVVKVAAQPPPPPPKPAEPEKPHLSLVGTIMGNSGQRIGLFVNAADKSPIRLRIGENDKGWVLREVQPRQVVLEKRPQSAVLKLVRLEASKAAAAPPAAPSKEAQPSNEVPPSNDKTPPVDEIASPTSSAVKSPNSSTIIIPKQSDNPLPPGEFTLLPPAAAHEPQVNPFQKARLH